ncbi:MAG: choice-of-anchor Q domain-containing protein [Bacteroidota bacterium]
MKSFTPQSQGFLFLLLLAFLLPATSAHSQTKQTWQQVSQRSTNFYEIKAAFMEEHAAKLAEYEKEMTDLRDGRITQITKGKYPGIKQFMRMAEWYEPRVKESNGDLRVIGQKDIEARINAMNTPQAVNAANWTILGPASIPTNTGNGRVNNLRIDPTNPNILYACTPASQLFKSTDAGATWSSISNGIPTTGVTDLAIDPTNTNILYAVTGDGDRSSYHPYSAGLYKSTNGGTSWNPTGLSYIQGNYVELTSIIIHPTSPNTILVSGTDGIRRSTDGGVTFTQTSTLAMQNLVFKPGDPNIVFAGSKYNGIFLRSVNNGVSWTQITSGLPASGADRFAIDVSPADPNYVYAMASNFGYNMQGFYRSVDGGLTFALMATSPNIGDGQSWYDFALCADPVTPNTVYACGVDIFKSINGGTTWTNLTNVYFGGSTGVHPDQHDLTFSGTAALYVANDGGIYRSTNAGVAWTNISANLTISQPYAIGLSATDPNTIILGTQDNGTILTNNLTSWRLTRGADGMVCFIDRTNDNNMYSSWQNGGLARSTNGGNSWLSSTTGLTGPRYWITPYMQDPVAPATIYCGTDKVFKSTNGAVNWTAISPVFGSVRWIDVDKNNTQVIYAMTNNSVQKTINGGTNWAPAATGIAGGELQHIHIDVNNSNILYVSTASYSGAGLFRSTDAGATWTNWGTGLPNVPVNTVVTVTGTAGEVYCGTDIGVYYRNTAAGSWTAFNTNLPVVPVRDLEIFYPSGALRAGTFGRGIWETQLNVPICGFTNGIVYVNGLAVGNNGGRDWANAFTDLKTAINAIPTINASGCNVTQIRVAAGTYKPTTGTDRNASFAMLNNIAIYGGFAGNEPANYDLSLRNFTANTTILSGNIGTAGNADNSYNVIKNLGNSLNNTAKLDGFTITGGNANGGNIVPTSNLNCGGGMYNSQSSPSISNCVFTNNSAIGSANTGGGGMFNYNSASPTISKCSFIGNTATSGGGGLFNNFGCSPAISNCIFTTNTSSGNGGGIHNYSSSNPIITSCRFTGNSAAGGGGLYNAFGIPSLTNCIFTGNNGGSNGGAIFQNNASLSLVNSSFSGNQATSGAGLKNMSDLAVAGSTSISNSIFWGDADTEIVTTNSGFGNAVTNITYSIVQGGHAGVGNLNVNPQFVLHADYHLKDQSPAIDAGTATGAPLLDIDAVTRTAVPDMGAYENKQSCLGGNKIYYSDSVGSSYQWQVFNGSNFINISNGAAYANVGTNKLTVITQANTTTGTRFRCAVTTPGGTVYSSEIILRFYNRWLGTASSDNWLNTANWSCSTVPDQYTDVIVPSAKVFYPLTNVSGTIRRLQAENGSSITVKTGSSLVIVGKD